MGETCSSVEAFEILGFTGGSARDRHHALKHLVSRGDINVVTPGGIGGRPPVVLDRHSVEVARDRISRGDINPWRALRIALGLNVASAPAAIAHQGSNGGGPSASNGGGPAINAVSAIADMVSSDGASTSAIWATWAALTELGAASRPVLAADVARFLRCSETNSTSLLRRLADGGAVIRHRTSRVFEYMIAGQAADEWTRAISAKRDKLVRVSSSELDHLRMLRDALSGIDPEKLRELVGGGGE